MAIDPRKFVYNAKCEQGRVVRLDEEQQKANFLREFGNLAGDIGGIEGLGEFGAFNRSLDQFITTLPTNLLDEIGGQLILVDGVGVSQALQQAAKAINPDLVNRSVDSAVTLYERWRNANLTFEDIPKVSRDIFDLSKYVKSLYTKDKTSTKAPTVRVCQASPYAVDLIERAPKYKFLFVVEFIYNPTYQNLMRDHAFVVKQCDRPNVSFVYEDINLYNYRTKSIKHAEYQPINMRFYDDDKNTAMSFYEHYLKVMSPIANIPLTETVIDSLGTRGQDFVNGINNNTVENRVINPAFPSGDFSNSAFVNTHKYASSIGPLMNNTKDILKAVNLYHIYDSGKRMNVYTFVNPKITELQLDELDMSIGSEGNEVSLTMAYDYVHLQTAHDFRHQSAGGTGEYNMTDLTNGEQNGAFYPLRHVGGDDTSTGDHQSSPIASGNVINDILGGVSETVNSITDKVTQQFNRIPDPSDAIDTLFTLNGKSTSNRS
jgi:hypothetical protein